MPITVLIRDGLRYKVEVLEEKHRQDEATYRAVKIEKEQQKVKLRVPVVGTPIAPLTPLSGTVSHFQSELDKMYDDHARNYINAGDDHAAQKEAAQKTIEAIQRARPLTAPVDHVILEKLEEHMLRLRAQGVKPIRTVDNMVGRVLDVSRFNDALPNVNTDNTDGE
jgi:hypothetical protein